MNDNSQKNKANHEQGSWIPETRQFYKHWSFWGIALLGFLPFLEDNSYAILSVIPDRYRDWVQLGLAVLVAVLRFIKQNNIDRGDD